MMLFNVSRQMRTPPALDWRRPTGPPRRRYALLVNPFYPKDPHASFGKHVLTPTLALTSLAAATPADWEVRYWDENLLQGPPPCDPLPQVVGISVHLTFARRAYQLGAWYRERGSKVVMGGLHATSCPQEVAAHADALAIGEGVQLWETILRDVDRGRLRPRYDGSFRRPFREEPAPRRELLDRRSFLTTTSLIATRGCHNRCDFCYLATDGLLQPYQRRDVEQVADEVRADGQPYAVFVDNNLGSRPDYLRRLCRALRPLEIIWSAAVTIDVTDDPSLVREMALAGCTGVFVGLETLEEAQSPAVAQEDPSSRGLRPQSRNAPRSRHTSKRELRAGIRQRRAAGLRADGGLDRKDTPGVRHLPYLDALPGDAALPSDGVGEPHPAPGLGSLRHRPCGLPPP